MLDRRFKGIVVAMDARFHVSIDTTHSGPLGQILVDSPQFSDGKWAYGYANGAVEQLEGRNHFVYVTMSTVFQFLHDTVPGFEDKIGKSVTRVLVRGDNDFYSQMEHVLDWLI